ncbi:MAG TPA: twin-arginine translocase subunit TatC [Candidatus Bathyarchaeia archaeon]|nr:twin-arginine translocase subunit TatC [Candidatus Bathyarchaeia archaeon]
MAEKKNVGQSFWGHLTELLKRVRTILYSLIICTIVAMVAPVSLDFLNFSTSNPFYPTITTLVIRNFQDKFLPAGAELLPMNPVAPLEIYMLIAIIIGLVLSFPMIAYELYKFLNPALHTHEKRTALQFVGSFVGLFIFGLALGYLFIVPTTMRTLFAFSSMLGLPARYDFAEFFSLIGFSLFLCGLIFTFPLYIVLLVKVGLLETKQVTKRRKYLYGGILILIAILDPEPGLVTEALVFVPIVILTEVSLIIAKRIEKTRARATEQSV